MSTSTPDLQPKHLLSDQLYNELNTLAVIVLPALGTLYFALAQIWGLPAAEQVVGTIVALDAFLGVLVKAGEASYNNSGARYSGAINVSQQADRMLYSLDLNHAPEELVNKDHVTFKVNKPQPSPLAPVASVPLPSREPEPPVDTQVAP